MTAIRRIESVGIGFRVKTGRVTAVVLSVQGRRPRVLDRKPIQLWSPEVPESQEPYHLAMELPAEQAKLVVNRARQALQSAATLSLRQLAEAQRASERRVCGVGLVVGSDVDPERLHNEHIRAHALEGRLSREVLESAAEVLSIPCLVLVERNAYDSAAARLGRPVAELKRDLTELGRSVGPPWGGEEKMACLAAWLALVSNSE